MSASYLQNPANKREINCDDKLKELFEGKEKVNFLEIGKLLSRHFVKAEWMASVLLGTVTSAP